MPLVQADFSPFHTERSQAAALRAAGVQRGAPAPQQQSFAAPPGGYEGGANVDSMDADLALALQMQEVGKLPRSPQASIYNLEA